MATVSGAVFMVELRKDQERKALGVLAHIRDGAPRAIAAAINKTAPGVRTDTVRTLSRIYSAKQSDIREAISIGRKASPANLRASVLGRYKNISLIKFKVRPRTITKRRPAGGIRAEVKRGETKPIPQAFVAPIGGGPQIALRKGRSRLPIRKLFGPSVVAMMQNDSAEAEVMRLGQARLDKNVEHEISRISKGKGK